MEGPSSCVDVEKIEAIFCEMRDQLIASQSSEQEQNKDLQSSVKKLDELAKPNVIMGLLAGHLFREASPNDKINSQDALSIVGYLVAFDSKYLKPASRAVRNEAVRLTTTTPDHKIIVSPELMGVMVAQLSGNDVQASTNATEAIVACCRKLGPSFAEPVLSAITEKWKQSWTQTHESNRNEASTIWVRCASAVVDIVSLDDSFMRYALSCGAMDLLLTMLTDESDPLLEMSTLELIEKLATTQPMHHERAKWLFSDKVLKRLLHLAGGTEEGVPDPILGGPALRVVAALCKLGHQDSSLFGLAGPELLTGFHRALHNFEASGELDRLAMIDAISSFASASPDALELVLADPVTREAWLSLSVAQPKLKSVILFSVSLVLDPSNEVDANGDSISTPPPDNGMGMKLFSSLGSTNNDEATNLVLSLAKSPLPETRLGAYALLKAVAKLPTGGQVLFAHPGFYEFLMDREIEKTKEGKEAKHAIVQTIFDSPVKGLLADDIVRQLEKYLKEGPHYVKTIPYELATD